MVVDDSGASGMLNTTIIDRVFVIVGGDNWVSVVVAVIILVELMTEFGFSGEYQGWILL